MIGIHDRALYPLWLCPLKTINTTMVVHFLGVFGYLQLAGCTESSVTLPIPFVAYGGDIDKTIYASKINHKLQSVRPAYIKNRFIGEQM